MTLVCVDPSAIPEGLGEGIYAVAFRNGYVKYGRASRLSKRLRNYSREIILAGGASIVAIECEQSMEREVALLALVKEDSEAIYGEMFRGDLDKAKNLLIQASRTDAAAQKRERKETNAGLAEVIFFAKSRELWPAIALEARDHPGFDFPGEDEALSHAEATKIAHAIWSWDPLALGLVMKGIAANEVRTHKDLLAWFHVTQDKIANYFDRLNEGDHAANYREAINRSCEMARQGFDASDIAKECGRIYRSRLNIDWGQP